MRYLSVIIVLLTVDGGFLATIHRRVREIISTEDKKLTALEEVSKRMYFSHREIQMKTHPT